jgi:hypothetical protein
MTYCFTNFLNDLKKARPIYGFGRTSIDKLIKLYIQNKAYDPLVSYLSRWNWEVGINEFFEDTSAALLKDKKYDLLKKLWLSARKKQKNNYLCTLKARKVILKNPSAFERIKSNISFIEDSETAIVNLKAILLDMLTKYLKVLKKVGDESEYKEVVAYIKSLRD